MDLADVGGTFATGEASMASITFSIRELDIHGGKGRWWNATNFQATAAALPVAMSGTNWARASSVVLPPLNSGQSFELTATATDSNSATINVSIKVQAPITVLNWDPGQTPLGTVLLQNPNTNGGNYWFKITAQNTTVGAWRTALNTAAGEADVYLRSNSPPTTNNYHFASRRAGADGFVLHSSQFNPGQDWYLLVTASTNAQWTLLTGEAYVHNLGPLVAGDSSSTNVAIGGEGMAFFKTTIDAQTLAWSLWLHGANNELRVRKSAAPHPASYASGEPVPQSGQMLVVPAFLASAVFNGFYFVSVSGAPGQTVWLDSRKQSATDIPFASTNAVITVTNAGYRLYRVQVPVQQIAWEVRALPVSGNPNLAVRRDQVPNEWNNDAFSATLGSLEDSLTLVPPTLSDGTFYVTVYGAPPYSFSLQSANPIVTDVPYLGANVNSDLNRVGWRFYRVTDIAAQLGTLGWDLLLRNAPPGTEIALRRNAVPGRWNYRADNSTSINSSGHVDFSSVSGELQRPAHQADIWYIGIYNPSAALDAFTLIRQELVPQPLAFNGSGIVTNQSPGNWRYFRIDVPPNALGWDLRIKDVTSGDPHLVVRRDQLPDGLSSSSSSSTVWYFYPPYQSITWPSGWQWAAGNDWTGRSYDPSGKTKENGRILAMGMGNPLEPGTYYVGVLNGSDDDGGTNAMSYILLSRGIGEGMAIPVVEVPFVGGSGVTTNIWPREAAYYRVVVPTNTASWQVRLNPSVGDALLQVQWQKVPTVNSYTTFYDERTPYADGGKKMQKAGKEQWVLLPENGTNVIRAGTYYLAAVSEGQSATIRDRIGTGASSWTFESFGAMGIRDLGTVGETDLAWSDTLEGGAAQAFQLTVPTGTLSMETRLENRVGNPMIKLVKGERLPVIRYFSSTSHDFYGSWGGVSPPAYGVNVITTANPTSGVFSLIVNASDTEERDDPNDSGAFSDARYTLRVHATIPVALAFDRGASTVTNQSPGNWRFFRIDVPTNALGWDLRLANVSSGDPHLVVRRDQLPNGLVTLSPSGSGWEPCQYTNWPSGWQWAADHDWTGRSYDPSGNMKETGRILAMGMGNPLEPGTYYVGVLNGANNDSGTNAMSYTLWSRGIGEDMAIPIVEVPFAGGSAATSDLLPREAAYYRVVVPTNTTSWQVRLNPSVGDALLQVQWQKVPTINRFTYDFEHTPYSKGGKETQKPGKEQWVLLPESGTNVIRAGTYYLVAASEGQNATISDRIGTGASSWTFESFGAMGVRNLGTIGETDLAWSDTLEGGAAKAYQFTVPTGTLSVETRLENRVGNPIMKLVKGERLPSVWYPSINVGHDYYGNIGGVSPPAYGFNLITTANPTPGVYSLIVNASDTEERDDRNDSSAFSDASYTLRISAVIPGNLSFDGGNNAVTNQPPGNWRYFQIDVPTNALGWDLRLANVTSGDPHLVVRRDQLPNGLVSLSPSGGGWEPCQYTNWPSGWQWAADHDWTGRSYDPSGNMKETGRILAMGMGNPLEPGTYYVGVLNGSNSDSGTNAMSYTLWSRGIGEGMAIPVVEVPFAGGSAATKDILPREAAYYRVVVPTNTASWQVRLNPSVGDALLQVQWQKVPTINRFTYDFEHTPYGKGGKETQKAGKEQWVLLPESGTDVIRAGTYYLAAASEGQNATISDRIGTGASSWTFESFGAMGVRNLGTVGETDLVLSDTLEGGAAKAYQFTVQAGTLSVEARLENRVGNPIMKLIKGERLPSIWYPSINVGHDYYGNIGGVFPQAYGFNLVTTANPTPGVYSLIVNASDADERDNFGDSGAFSDASYTLRVRYPIPSVLNFSANLNANGQTNAVSGTLADNQRAFFKVIVPATNDGHAVVGWRLDLTQLNGSPSVRVRKDLLPVDDSNSGTSPFASTSAYLVPPYLTPGTWYVEVRGSGATDFTLSSSVLSPEQTWIMPEPGQPTTTPGLGGLEFGDSGKDTNGNGILDPQTGTVTDYGIDLEQGRMKFYAIIMPTNNVGLFRTVLEAISGNPDLYLRFNLPPTRTHGLPGGSGTALFDRSQTGTTTEYGNWVPIDSRYEARLAPGTWYLAVHAAGNSNARYRLHVAAGSIQDLALEGGSYAGQTLLGGDWRHYRVQIPLDAPVNWNVTFSQQSGDVVLYLRDSLPAGIGTSGSDYRDWNADFKNNGVHPKYDSAGTYAITVPPLRPGHTYYLSFRAVNDAMFSVNSATSGGVHIATNTVAFYGGFVTNQLSPYGTALYRIDVPSDAARWKSSATNSSSVVFYIEQGTVPLLSSQHYRSSGANRAMNYYLRTLNNWPWVPNQSYFLLITNTAAISQPFSFTMNGRSLATDDEDNDGLPDAWELTYWSSTGYNVYGPTSDPDNDGNNNRLEFQDGTNPTNATSMLARLTVLTNGLGEVTVTPQQDSYLWGTPILLTATPAGSSQFLGWGGTGISGITNPLSVHMTTNRTISANFGENYNQPLLTATDYRFQGSLSSSVGTPPDLTYVGAGHYFTNELVDGVLRTTLRFPQGSGLQLAPATTVFASNVYTVAMLLRFDNVSGYRRILDVKSGTSDSGWYVYGGKIYFNPGLISAAVALTNNIWHQVVLTRDSQGMAVMYCDGVQQLTYNDASTSYGVINSSNTMRFFKDNGSEESAGSVARIRNYASSLTSAEVAALERLPDRSPAAFLHVPLINMSSAVTFDIEASAGLVHRVQVSFDLISWQNLTNVASTNGVMPFIDIESTNYPWRFYRMVSP